MGNDAHVFSIPEEPWGYLFVGMVPQDVER
jgi:hypothetical protein